MDSDGKFVGAGASIGSGLPGGMSGFKDMSRPITAEVLLVFSRKKTNSCEKKYHENLQKN